MDVLRSRVAGSLSTVCCVAWAVSCATYVAPLAPERIDRVPDGPYHVKVSESTTGGERYNAVLLEKGTVSMVLDRPTVDEGTRATVSDYQAALRPGFVVYEIRDHGGEVQGYLLAPPQARVRVWDLPGNRGVLVVTASDLESVPEMGGGGGGGGGGGM